MRVTYTGNKCLYRRAGSCATSSVKAGPRSDQIAARLDRAKLPSSRPSTKRSAPASSPLRTHQRSACSPKLPSSSLKISSMSPLTRHLCPTSLYSAKEQPKISYLNNVAPTPNPTQQPLNPRSPQQHRCNFLFCVPELAHSAIDGFFVIALSALRPAVEPSPA